MGVLLSFEASGCCLKSGAPAVVRRGKTKYRSLDHAAQTDRLRCIYTKVLALRLEPPLFFFLSGKGSKLTDHVNFAGVSEVDVEKDILVSGGENGLAVLSGVENLISEDPPRLPEPSSLAT